MNRVITDGFWMLAKAVLLFVVAKYCYYHFGINDVVSKLWSYL